MNWLTFLLPLIRLILERILGGLANGSTQFRAQTTPRLAAQLANTAAEFFPILNVSCLQSVLAGWLDAMADIVRGDSGKVDWTKAIEPSLDAAVQYVKCHFSANGQTLAQADQEALIGNLLTCGLNAFVEYSVSKDIQKTITGFLACILSGVGSGGGTTPPGGGSGFVSKEVVRCPQ